VIRDLLIQTPDRKVRRVPLEADVITLGRAHTNDLCYPNDASLSRTHLRLERSGDSWTVVDLDSKNGTMLNGVRLVDRQTLHPGDRLSAGQLVITCSDPAKDEDTNVVFVQSSGPELSESATVMTSLEGLLSDEAAVTVPPVPAAPEMDSRRQFQLPIVRALIRAGRELAGHRPLEELFPLVLDQAIEAVQAERGVLMTLDGERLVARATHGEGFRISTTIRDRVLRDKESLLVRDVGQEEALLQQLSISEQQIHSLMAVPLQTRDDVIGLIYVDSRLFVREFTPDDLNLLTVLANVAAIRIDHEQHRELQRQEQRRTRDLEQAAEIQRGILPARPPRIRGLDVAGHNAPCRTVGGDYYDFFRYPEGRLALVLADVAGKGMAAAMLMSNLQARVQLLMEAPPESLAALVDRLDRSISANCPPNRFITLFLCVVDPETGAVEYCNAGHNPALLVRSSGRVEMLEAVGTVLGILPELGYEARTAELGPGELIAIYSDGVTEATGLDGEEFGLERLADLLASKRSERASDIAEAVLDGLRSWCASEVAEDDVTLVVVRRTAD
jgi:serine phosphatase RsbU (regulator of sigma subunit)/pSer/pThr/pTyr-binding forkhead associated (FHA) protein